MGVRGRTSGAALAIPREDNVVAGPGLPGRIPPDLGEYAAEQWRKIMDSPAGEMIPIEAHPLLAEFCRLSETCHVVGLVVNKITAADLVTTNRAKNYERLTSLRERSGVRMAALSVKLRLAPSSRVHKGKAGTIGRKPRGEKPWEH